MAEAVKINVLPRTGKGSSEGRRLRREGFFPGVVYGSGNEAELVKVNEHEFRKGLSGHANEHLLLDLVIDGRNAKKVILQEVQHDALSGKIIHVDFHEVSMTEKLRVEVKLKLVGTPVGVSMGGGVLEHPVREIEVECLPGDLMEAIEVDVSKLEIGDNLTVADIKLDTAKYEILTDADVAIAAVAEPTKEIEAEPVEGAEAAEGGESPAVVDGEEKKEEDASAKDAE